MANIPITALNGGEYTSHIDARADVEKYASGCRHLENMLPRIYGGVTKRPGTQQVAGGLDWKELYMALIAYENKAITYENYVLML